MKAGDRPPGAAGSEPGEGTALGFETYAETSAVMLDLVYANGSRVAMPYALLTAAKLSNEGDLALEYPDKMVCIRGRNLLPLYQNILAHLARRVFVSPTAFDDGASGTWVSSIAVSQRE